RRARGAFRRRPAGPRGRRPHPGRGHHLPHGGAHQRRRRDPLPRRRRGGDLEGPRPRRAAGARAHRARPARRGRHRDRPPGRRDAGRGPARAHEPGPRTRPHGPLQPRLRGAHAPAAGAAGAAAGRAGGRGRVGRNAPMTTVAVKPATMAQALTRALRDSMAADPSVHVMGEDVGTLGGVFRITDGLAEEFGDERCTDTPLAEAGILGTAVGMAMYGLRPVVEMQFDAFAYPAFEQLLSHVAKTRNRTRGAMPLPITIRVPYGGGIGGVEHHSDSSEAYYMATPGLHVVTPA